MKVKIIREVYSDKQRRFFCASDDPELKKMCDDPMKEEALEEISAVASVAGAPAANGGPWRTEEEEVEKFNKKEKEISKLKEESLDEMYSTMGLKTGGMRNYPDEAAGFQERAAYQGLKNTPKPKKRIKIKVRRKKKPNLNENSSTAAALIKFANIGHIKGKRNSLWGEFLEKYGLETLAKAIINDDSSQSRIEFIKKELGSSRDFDSGVKNLDNDVIRDYYDFLMNEYLFWSYYNPHASPMRYANSVTKVPTAAKDLIRGHISRYISNPSRNNPAALSRRAIGRDSSSQKIYNDKPTLDAPLYDLPE